MPDYTPGTLVQWFLISSLINLAIFLTIKQQTIKIIDGFQNQIAKVSAFTAQLNTTLSLEAH